MGLHLDFFRSDWMEVHQIPMDSFGFHLIPIDSAGIWGLLGIGDLSIKHPKGCSKPLCLWVGTRFSANLGFAPNSRKYTTYVHIFWP